MRRSKLFSLLTLVLSSLMLFSAFAVAQDEEEEDETLQNLRRSVALFLSQSVSSDMSHIYDTRKLLDLGPLSVEFQSLPLGSRIEFETPQIPVFKVFGFSTTLPNPFIGSPAYEIVNTWRNSLNKDVITGKYYWEW